MIRMTKMTTMTGISVMTGMNNYDEHNNCYDWDDL